MKTKHFFLAAAALISALVACQKKTEDLGPEKVEINTAEVSLPADGGEATVNLTATVDWKAQIPAEAQEWLVVTPEEGSASASAQTVKVKALKNDGDVRFASISFLGVEQKKALIVSQKGGKLSLGTDRIDFDKEGGEKILGFTSMAFNWSVQVPKDAQEWLTVSPSEGSASTSVQTIKIRVAKNDDYNRSAELTFLAGSQETFLTVDQHGPKSSEAGKMPEYAEKMTISEFFSKPVRADVWYELTGKIVSIANKEYGNITIKDETDAVYVYGVVKEWADGENDKSFSQIGLKVGDVVTIWTLRGEYGGEPQAGGSSTSGGAPAIYKSHTAGAEVTYPTGSVILSFPDDNSENNKISAYNKSWEAKIGKDEFTIDGFNNNSWKDWSYIKCGSKNFESVASIANKTAVAVKVTKVVLNIDNVSAEYVNSIKLSVFSDAGLSKEVCSVNPTGAIEPGDLTFEIPAASQATGLYYKAVFDCKQGKSNGIVQLSKVIYVAAE